jgi:hypothetical protein
METSDCMTKAQTGMKYHKRTAKSKSKIQRDHETQLALINAFARDPELKYFMGMAAGAGVAWIGALLGDMNLGFGNTTDGFSQPSDLANPPNPADYSSTEAYLDAHAEWMRKAALYAKGLKTQEALEAAENGLPYLWLLSGGAGGVLGLAVVKSIDWSGAGGGYADVGTGQLGGLSGQIANILKLGGTGFAGTCAMILILRSIFSGTDLGELLSGVGEIIPL